MNSVQHNVAGLILAGGQSRRMSSRDKALLPLGGHTLLDHVIARLGPQVSPLVLSANGELSRFATFRLTALPDSTETPGGPLAGILAGLRWVRANTTAQWLGTVPVDTPFLPHTFIARLLACIDSPTRIAVARSRGQIHPVAALWPVQLADDLANWLLQEGNRAVRDWIKTQPSTTIDFDDEDDFDPFFNINTPDDLAKAQDRAESLSG